MVNSINNQQAPTVANASNDATKQPQHSIEYTYSQMLISQAKACQEKVELYMKVITKVNSMSDSDRAAWVTKCTTIMNSTSFNATAAKELFSKLGITYPSNLSLAELKGVAEAMKNVCESPEQGTIYLNNYMGQYNSFSDGASKAVADLRSILESIARRM